MHLPEDKDIPCSEYRPMILIAQNNKEDLHNLSVASDNYNKYDYVLATTGMSIIDEVNKHCFDAVVLGLKFPDITGSTVAYLIHEFDPLVSLIFLSAYNNNIIVAAVQELHSQFLDKTEEFKNLPNLCDKIYKYAIEMPCANPDRIISRTYMKQRRELYNKYHKLYIPSSLAQVAKGR